MIKTNIINSLVVLIIVEVIVITSYSIHYTKLYESIKNAVISRVKILASLDIAERRIPQDGRIKLRLGKKKSVDFRVSRITSYNVCYTKLLRGCPHHQTGKRHFNQSNQRRRIRYTH